MVQMNTSTRLNPAERLPWADRFSKPAVDQLLSHYDAPNAQLFETARESLSESEGVQERVAWQGLPWRWTLVFEHPSDPTRAFVYLVPDPQSLKISVPLTQEMVQGLPLRRMKKHIRDGIETGNQVNSVIWACWEVQTENQLEEILEIICRKHSFIEGRVA
jgi:hypothetical protein